MDAAASDLNERRKARGLELFRGARLHPAARNDATRTLKLSAAGSDFTSRDFEIISEVDVQTAVAATFRGLVGAPRANTEASIASSMTAAAAIAALVTIPKARLAPAPRLRAGLRS